MKRKDIEMFWKSVLHSVSSKNDKENTCWWDITDQEKLEQIVEHLSDPNTPERREIRKILVNNNIHSILDAGCGPGTELEGYKATNMDMEYIGLDMSTRMIETAKKRYPGYHFVLGDINKMQFNDCSYDAVVLKHVLEHLSDYKNAVNEAVRVASKIVIIDFFHMLWFFDYRRKHKEGFWENWYGRKKFEKFIRGLPISHYDTFRTVGTSRQTAEICVLYKN